MKGFFQIKRAFLCFLASCIFLFGMPKASPAQIQVNEVQDGSEFTRSLESLRDLDYQTWQVVVYSKNGDSSEKTFVLRIVGYPGTLRINHPTSLEVHSGRRDWVLQDITLSNPQLAKDPREAAAEFDLSPLLFDLRNNRPLRLKLPGVITELPVPPYVVSEWRSFSDFEST